LTLEKGVVVYIDSGVSIRIKGVLECTGDSLKRISLRASRGHCGWGVLELIGCHVPTIIRHTDLSNGRLVYHDCQVSLYDVRFLNHVANLDAIEGRPSLVWGQRGNFLMDRCLMSGNGTGEGINLHGGWPRVTNSVFVRVPDAIEFISADSGLIAFNDVGFSKDDGIDLNDCRNMRITGNYIHHNFDKAVSAGVDHHGSSHKIEISGNIFYKNAYGCDIKDSSDATVSNNVIYDFRYGVLSRQKEPGYQIGGNVLASSNILFGPQGSTAFKSEGRSTLTQKGNRFNYSTDKSRVIDSSYFFALTETPFFPKDQSVRKAIGQFSPYMSIQASASDLVITNEGLTPIDIGHCRMISGDK
ncbi:MAG: right-handed parallel beta-helix repeat-containing protein, partial [Flavobacteriales bacterium]